jgi:hypothetical protein
LFLLCLVWLFVCLLLCNAMHCKEIQCNTYSISQHIDTSRDNWSWGSESLRLNET